MKILRRMLGWLFIGLGAFALTAWASASFVTHRVDSGSFASPFIGTVLHQEDTQQRITEQAQSLITTELNKNGVFIEGTIEGQALNDAIARAVASEDFIDDLTDIVKEAEADIIAQLTDDTLLLGPLVITIDVTEPLYAAIVNTPGVSGLVPPTKLEPITIEPLDAHAVGNVRDGYDWVQAVSLWGLWVGLALLVIGFLLLPRKRWIIPKILLGLGITALILWFLASKMEVETFLDRFSDDTDSEFRKTMGDLVTQQRVDGLQSDLLKISLALFVLAAIAYTLVWALSRKHRSTRVARREPEPEPELEPELEPEPLPVATPAEAEPPAGAVASTPPTQEMHPTGSTPTSDGTPLSESGDSAADHPEPGSPSKKSGHPTGSAT